MKAQNKKGLSLVELLIVAAIMALALIPILTLLSSRTNQAIGTGHNACAHNHLLNTLRHHESRLYAMAFSTKAEKTASRNVKVNWGDSELTLLEEVTVEHCIELPELWRLRATITWSERNGSKTVNRSQNLVRLIANPMPEKKER